MFSSQIEMILKQIHPSLEYEIVMSNEKVEKDRLLNSLKSKFGDNLNIK